MGRARNIGFYALFSKIFSFWLRIGAIFIRISDLWLRNGAIFRLWHQNWCRFRERDFCRGIKIDAILITSSLIPSRLSHLARVIFQNIYFLYLFPVGSDEIEGVFQKFFLSLIRTGRGRFSRCFWKISWYSVAVLESVYCPFTYSMFESHFVTP